MIEYMEEEHASKESTSPGQDFLFQVNEWGSNGVIEKFYSVLGGFSLRKTYDIVYALIALNIADRIRDGRKRHIPLFKWNGMHCIEDCIVRVRKKLDKEGMSPSEGKIKAVNLEEISSQLFEYVVWEADRAVNVLTWEACLRSVGGDEDVKDNAKRRLNDILSVWKALGVVDFKPGKSRWSEGIVLNLAFFSEGNSVQMAQASLHAIAEKARRESTVVPFSEMATPSPGAKELPNVAKSEDVSKEGIDSSIDVKTDKKQSVVTEETAAEEPQPEKVEKSTSSTIAENDDSAKCADVKEVDENKKLNGSIDAEEVKETTASFEIYADGPPLITDSIGPFRIPIVSDHWPGLRVIQDIDFCQTGACTIMQDEKKRAEGLQAARKRSTQAKGPDLKPYFGAASDLAPEKTVRCSRCYHTHFNVQSDVIKCACCETFIWCGDAKVAEELKLLGSSPNAKNVTPQVDFDARVSLNCQFCSLRFEIPIRVDGKRITESNKIAVGISMTTPLSRVVSGNQDFGCAGAFRCSRCYSVHVICAKYQAIEKKDESTPEQVEPTDIVASESSKPRNDDATDSDTDDESEAAS